MKILIGHVGRLAFEKNLAFLAEAVAGCVMRHPAMRFVVVGRGAAEAEILRIFHKRGLEDRLILTGEMTGQDLVDAYHAMDVFVFAFAFEHPQLGTVGMLSPEAVETVEAQLQAGGPGLLAGGSCYSDIYRGGAAEPHFGPAAVGYRHPDRRVHLWRWAIVGGWHSFVVVRTLALLLIELGLALCDGISGFLQGESRRQEIKFIAARVGISILLRRTHGA